MNIKNLNIKKQVLKTKLCTLSLASIMTVTMTGCSNSRSNHNPKKQEQPSIETVEEEKNVYLDSKSSEIYSVTSLSNGEKRGILLSNEPHPYKTLFEETNTKVYLSDEDGNRLSNNFDKISLLSNYEYLTTGGMLLGDWASVITDKKYNYFVGENLPKKQNDKPLVGSTITLLDENGFELCSFNGFFKALIGNRLVIQDYFEGEDRPLDNPDTYLYDYITDKKSKKHDYVQIFKYKNEQNEEVFCLIGVDLYYENHSSNHVYSFYNENLEIIDSSTEEEMEDWYRNNNLYDDYSNHKEYFKSIYQNKKAIKQVSGIKLIKKK